MNMNQNEDGSGICRITNRKRGSGMEQGGVLVVSRREGGHGVHLGRGMAGGD